MGKICQHEDRGVYRSITPEVFDGLRLYCCRSACDYPQLVVQGITRLAEPIQVFPAACRRVARRGLIRWQLWHSGTMLSGLFSLQTLNGTRWARSR
jgi:hypothetical protein